MHVPTASVICDSIGDHSPRLTTFMTSYWKAVHAEHMRHRTGSYCVSSSRAIPVSRNLEIVRSDELRAGPIFWGAEQKGMSPGGELDDVEANLLWESGTFSQPTPERFRRFVTAKNCAQLQWKQAAEYAVKVAEEMVKLGVHKSIVNRLLDPFLPVNVLVTSCEPGLLNFFGLRLDKAADPTIRALAEAMWAAWNESEPQKLEGGWHLPFIDETEWRLSDFSRYDPSLNIRDGVIRVSVARCARLSYMSYETQKRSTIEEDLALYERLVGAHPIHASPAEHQATPDVVIGKKLVWKEHGPITYDKITGYPVIDHEDLLWKGQLEEVDAYRNEDLHGNLPGWIQFRKTLPNEAVAPLPEGYVH